MLLHFQNFLWIPNLYINFSAQTTTYSEAACELNTNLIVHPFAFRVHTHGLGRVVSGWKVTPDMSWTLLGNTVFNMISQ